MHSALVVWERGEADFGSLRYSRRHFIRFDGGFEMPASSSPHSVPLPWSDASAVDPEEAFIAALASCHMLWFLSLAARAGFCVDRYEDDARGELGIDARGRKSITVVTLRPRVLFSGERSPTRAELDSLHHAAHEECFISNSVRSEVRVEPRD
ncbi:MAG TPA: OsmC family protein [Steroidobacteraceae bacterium]|nr:OsmC family protein [Steroidobacteraceae bacterium]